MTTALGLGMKLLDVLFEELGPALVDFVIDKVGPETVRSKLDARLEMIDSEAQRKLKEKFASQEAITAKDPPTKDRVG